MKNEIETIPIITPQDIDNFFMYVATIINSYPPSIPTSNDIESKIREKLENEGTILDFQTGNHKWIKHDNPASPHHYAGSSVLWADTRKDKKPDASMSAWEGNLSIRRIIKDENFCNETDVYIEASQQTDNRLRFYHFVGFPKEEEKSIVIARDMADVVAQYGAKSQQRLHMHAARGIYPNDPLTTIKRPHEISSENVLIQRIFDLGVKYSLERFSKELSGFGTRRQYIQRIGSNGVPIQRTVFEFDTWHAALAATYELKHVLSQHWLNHAYTIGREPIQFADRMYSMQKVLSCIPVFAIVKPSIMDQKYMNCSTKWIVIPFSLEMPSTLLGGVVLNRINAKK